jgi:hypothetical protein
MIVRVPPAIAAYAEVAAKEEFLKGYEIVRSIMNRGMLQHQTERERARKSPK